MWDRLRPLARFLAQETRVGFTVGAILAGLFLVVGVTLAIVGRNDGLTFAAGLLLAGVAAGMVVASIALRR